MMNIRLWQNNPRLSQSIHYDTVDLDGEHLVLHSARECVGREKRRRQKKKWEEDSLQEGTGIPKWKPKIWSCLRKSSVLPKQLSLYE